MTCSAALRLEIIVQYSARTRLAQATDAAQLALDLKEWLNARRQRLQAARDWSSD
jgi:hypothetical protein